MSSILRNLAKAGTVIDLYYQSGTGTVLKWDNITLDDVDEFFVQFTVDSKIKVEPIASIVRIFEQ